MNFDRYYEKLEKMSTDDLFGELGSMLADESLAFADEDHGPHGRFGREWFEANLSRIREKVCGNARIASLMDAAEGGPTAGLIGAVADAISDLTSSHLTAAIAAVLAIRYGLKRLCAPKSDDE